MSQNKRILQYLLKGRSLTPLQALKKFGCLRLAARINDLRDLGYKIESEIVYSEKKHFSKYKIQNNGTVN